MPAFTATYTESQRAALVRAVLADKMSVRAALQAAKAGELPDLSAEDAKGMQTLSYVYACQIIREHRDELDGVQRARSHPQSVSKDAATLLLRRAQKDALQIANGRKGLMDADSALKTLRVIEACQKVLAGLEPRKPTAKTEGAAPSKPRSLASQIAARASTEPDDNHTPTDTDEVSATPTRSNDNEATDDANEGPARSNAARDGGLGVAELAGTLHRP